MKYLLIIVLALTILSCESKSKQRVNNTHLYTNIVFKVSKTYGDHITGKDTIPLRNNHGITIGYSIWEISSHLRNITKQIGDTVQVDSARVYIKNYLKYGQTNEKDNKDSR